MKEVPDGRAGATWRCVDLHLHTPGIHSFALPPGADVDRGDGREEIADKYVERLVEGGVEVAVFTDYQGVRPEWYTIIRDRATGAGITVFPGAEMSIRQSGGKGLHLLIVCNPDTDPGRIAEVIRFQGSRTDSLFFGREQHTDLDLRASLPDALRSVRNELRCVIIAAHAADKNGTLRVLGPEQTAMLVRDGLVDALDQCEDAVTRLQGTNVLSPEKLRSLACTLSSDPKNLDEIGNKHLPDGRRRLTWIKLSRLDADALQLALHDPQTRLLTRQPQPARHPRVLFMEVQGGFLDGLALHFNDDLTTLIGGRGAGKSATLETLRYALDAPIYADESERRALVRRALGSGGRVRLVVERPGPQQQRYEITRVLDQGPRVLDMATEAMVEVPPMELFGANSSPVILLQREIQEVARSDGFRRRLLDEIIGDDARQADAAVQRTVEELFRNQRAIEDIEGQIAKRDEYVERLNKLKAEIKFFEQQGVAHKLDRHSKVGADKARLDTVESRIARAADTHTKLSTVIVEYLTAAATDLRAAESEHANLLAGLAADTDAIRDRVVVALTDAENELRPLRERLARTTADWPTRVAGLEEDLRRIQAELGVDQLDAKRYVDAIRERTSLQSTVDGLASQAEELQRLQSVRTTLLHRLQDERREGFALRQAAASQVNQQLAGTLRMEVRYLSDTTGFANNLSSLSRGSGVSSEAIDAIATKAGTDGAELARIVNQGEEVAANHFGITGAMARRLVHWLTSEPDRLRRVEALAPDDHVSISLFVDGEPRDLAQLSSGQKATALLLLVFAQANRPLILDQPEDDLDNRFVYEDVVSLLRAEKGVIDSDRRRQTIAATHNANIPVNGDAELVLSLADEGGQCVVRTRASIDDMNVRREIRSVLEGGADAFRRRAEKYGGTHGVG